MVIKYGGHAMDDEILARAFCENLGYLRQQQMEIAVVHGGGPQIGQMLKKLNIESSFRNGLRVTDRDTLDVVEMVLCGKVNKYVTREFLRAGLDAVGISGMDGKMLLAEITDPALGYVGEIVAVNPALVDCLMQNNFLPVISPLALGQDSEPLNVNADTAAGALAGALHADYFVLVSDVPGVLDADGTLLPKLSWEQVEKLQRDGVITGGMCPKVASCRNALQKGCKKAVILDGRAKSSLKKFLQGEETTGTLIV